MHYAKRQTASSAAGFSNKPAYSRKSIMNAEVDEEEKHILANRYKTKLCKNWVSSGSCPYETRCMFAHGEDEMRTSEENMRDGLVTEEAIKAFQHQQTQQKRRAAAAAAAAAVSSNGVSEAATAASVSMASRVGNGFLASADRVVAANNANGSTAAPMRRSPSGGMLPRATMASQSNLYLQDSVPLSTGSDGGEEGAMYDMYYDPMMSQPQPQQNLYYDSGMPTCYVHNPYNVDLLRPEDRFYTAPMMNSGNCRSMVMMSTGSDFYYPEESLTAAANSTMDYFPAAEVSLAANSAVHMGQGYSVPMMTASSSLSSFPMPPRMPMPRNSSGYAMMESEGVMSHMPQSTATCTAAACPQDVERSMILEP